MARHGDGIRGLTLRAGMAGFALAMGLGAVQPAGAEIGPAAESRASSDRDGPTIRGVVDFIFKGCDDAPRDGRIDLAIPDRDRPRTAEVICKPDRVWYDYRRPFSRADGLGNRDGAMSQAEFKTFLQEFDADKNGKLSENELRRLQERFPVRPA